MGDGMMVFWGAPMDDLEHASHACQAVLQMQAALKQLNEEWLIENKPVLTTRIGVNTGRVVVGNVGSEEKLSYTAIGDSINVGSRLQDLNKLYKTKILVTESTYQAVKEYFSFRLLDYVAVRGKKEGIYIYELLKPTEKEIALNKRSHSAKLRAIKKA
jgi:adenylate cyclase